MNPMQPNQMQMQMQPNPSGATAGMANWQIGMLTFATVIFLGFVYMSRPETEEEKRYYRSQRSRA